MRSDFLLVALIGIGITVVSGSLTHGEKRSGKGAASAADTKVSPGDVKWHANYQAACAASEISGKPVLLFQLMGKLDDEFC